jgi:hypothetical protein
MTGERIGLPHRGNVTFVRVLAVDRAPMLSPQNCPEKAADRFVGRMAGINTPRNSTRGGTMRPRHEALLRS